MGDLESVYRRSVSFLFFCFATSYVSSSARDRARSASVVAKRTEKVCVSLPRGHPQFRSNPLRLILCELKYKIEGLWTEYTVFFVTLIFRSLEPGTASRENLLSFMNDGNESSSQNLTK